MTREEIKEMLIKSYSEKNLPYSDEYINRETEKLMELGKSIEKAFEPLEEAVDDYLKTAKELNKSMMNFARQMSGERQESE